MALNEQADETAYRLEKLGTGAGVGWFSCVPDRETDMEAGFAYLAERPLDRFMHQHVLSLSSSLEPEEMARIVDRGGRGEPHVLAVAYEACMGVERFHGLLERFDREVLPSLARYTPHLHIPWTLHSGSRERLYWIRCFSRNAALHEPLPRPGEAGHAPLVDEEAIEAWKKGIVPIDRMGFSRAPAGGPMETGAGPARSAVKALQRRLEETGVLEGWETRTESTLSPFAVERPWRLEIRTRHGRHKWRLQGTQTSYGRGLAIQQARMSCLMEIVERISAFASFEPDRVPGIGGRASNASGLGPGAGGCGPPCPGPRSGFGWRCPTRVIPSAGSREKRRHRTAPFRVLVPAQLVFLFANLDEASLTSGLSSNGLGAGKTTAQARLSGLLEVIERDSERVVPFSPMQCFVLEAEDPRVSEMLSDLERKGPLHSLSGPHRRARRSLLPGLCGRPGGRGFSKDAARTWTPGGPWSRP